MLVNTTTLLTVMLYLLYNVYLSFCAYCTMSLQYLLYSVYLLCCIYCTMFNCFAVLTIYCISVLLYLLYRASFLQRVVLCCILYFTMPYTALFTSKCICIQYLLYSISQQLYPDSFIIYLHGFLCLCLDINTKNITKSSHSVNCQSVRYMKININTKK